MFLLLCGPWPRKAREKQTEEKIVSLPGLVFFGWPQTVSSTKEILLFDFVLHCTSRALIVPGMENTLDKYPLLWFSGSSILQALPSPLESRTRGDLLRQYLPWACLVFTRPRKSHRHALIFNSQVKIECLGTPVRLRITTASLPLQNILRGIYFVCWKIIIKLNLTCQNKQAK